VKAQDGNDLIIAAQVVTLNKAIFVNKYTAATQIESDSKILF
jgi:hypothetical protein